MPLAYGGMVSSLAVGPVRLYVWAAVKNGLRYLYAQLYAGWRRRKTVYLGKDVNEVAGRIVSATAELGCTAQWSAAEKAAKKLLQEFAIVKAVYEALRRRVWEGGRYAKFAAFAKDVVAAIFDLDAADAEAEVDQEEAARRLERLGEVVAEYADYA